MGHKPQEKSAYSMKHRLWSSKQKSQIVLDWCTKEIIGYSLSMRSKTDDWLDAVEAAVTNRFPEGIREALKNQQLFLLSDNGCQSTSQRFMMNCSLLGIAQIFTT